MAVQAEVRVPRVSTPRALSGNPAGSLAFDWTMAILAVLLMGGLYLDGWAHSHGRVDNTFFTPWHALLYSIFAVSALILVVTNGRNYGKGYAWRRSLPQGYGLSLLGTLIFAFGGVFDLIWHSLFGFEVNLETLLSPSHLILATGGVLIMTGPMRYTWRRASGTDNVQKSGWRHLGPLVLSMLAAFATLTFFTQFNHPLGRVDAVKSTASQPVSTIYSMNLDGTDQTRLNVTPDKFGWFGVPSPDGSKIAYSVGVANAGTGELYVMNADGTDPTPITKNGGANWEPSWSPDGSQIAFISNVHDGDNVYVIDAQGGTPKALTHSGNAKWGTSWTPDGKQIAFTIQNDGIYLVNVSGGDPVRLASTGSADSGPAWSLDGKQIAFTRYENSDSSIYLMNSDGSDLRKLADSSANPQWLPDNRIVFNATRTEDLSEIFAMKTDGTNPVNLTSNPGMSSYLPMVSAKTNKIVYTANGLDARPSWLTERAGVGAILFQSALMMGIVLLLVRRWRLPFGAITLIVGLTSLLLATNTDLYPYVPGAVIASVIADILLQWLKPTGETPGRFYLFAFLVPVIFYTLYFTGIAVTSTGIAWTVHIWLGAIAMAGIVGLFVGLLVIWPFAEAQSRS